MSATDSVFAGSIPALYERYMVPMLFAPYAALIAQRAQALEPRRIIETAAGTGVVTEALHSALPDAGIVATDLNQPMLDIAALKVRSPKVSFAAADALALPFDDQFFDLAVCQFGIMFFPDKVQGNIEARRVLRDGGTYLLAIWDSIERNPATSAAGRAVAELFPGKAAAFYERIPFRYHEVAGIERDLRAAGFTDFAIETIELRSRAKSAAEAALGFVQGSPMRTEIESLNPAMLAPATEAAARALVQFEGSDGLDAPMSAHIVRATR
ncbi:MAG: methyltransferase domain-containing protein [Pseudomonadota bacterium]